jgi:hypothetical protein
MNFSAISHIKYHALGHDLSSKEYHNLQSAVKTNPYLIVMEKVGTWYNYEYTNPVCEIKIFNAYGTALSEIKEGQWILNGPYVLADYYHKVIFIYGSIIDPMGERLNGVEYGAYFEGVKKAIIKLREMASFESIANYNLFQVNLALKKEITKQKSENENLLNILNTLKKT